jgi:energy-converting hydrogenase Eha subunit A
MGQQQTMTVAAEVKRGGAMLLRRMILVLAVAALMGAMMAVSDLPAMAKTEGHQPPGRLAEKDPTIRQTRPSAFSWSPSSLVPLLLLVTSPD